MAEAGTKVRVCQACGKDCTGQPRIKDKKGRYLHKACYEKALAKAKRKKPVEVLAPPAPENDDLYALEGADLGLGEDMLGDIPAHDPNGASCPDCGSAAHAGAVLCTVCGHNFQTGRSAGRVKVSRETALGSAAKVTATTSAAWLLALIGASIGGFIGAVAWAMVAFFFNLEHGYVAVGVGFLCGLGAVMGAQSKAGMVSGLVASGVAILAIIVGKLAVVQVTIDSAVSEVRQSIQAQMQNPDQPWFTDDEAIYELVSDESLRKERRGERLRWPFGQSWEDAYELEHYPTEVRNSVTDRWKRLSEGERSAKKDEMMRENMAASIASEIAFERAEAGQQLTWPANMTYEKAYLVEDYPRDIVTEAQARWDAMSRVEQANYLNEGFERYAAMLSSPEMSAAAIGETYDGVDFAFDALWIILAVGVAFGTGANVASGETGF